MNAEMSPSNPLLVPELFYSILDWLCPETDQHGMRTVAALARTCRAFSEPSLDRLWCKQYSLRPLIQCYAGPDGARIQIPPSDSKIAVIERHAHRIRELVVSDCTSSCLLEFISIQPSSCLLPNLQVLRWGHSNAPHCPIAFIQRLLSPCLVSLVASLAESDGPALLSFFNDFPLLCPNLTSVEFRFTYESGSTTTTDALSRAICRQATLEKVVLRKTSIDNAALRHLSTLPCLKFLSLALSDVSMSEEGTLLSHGPLFRSLEELDIETSDLHLVTSLLCSHDHGFHTFSLNYPARMTSDDAIHLFRMLASRPPDKPLCALTLTTGDYSHPLSQLDMARQAARYRLSPDTLQPLQPLGSSLRALTIEWTEQISLDDADLTALARTWPRLEVLHLHCGRGGYPPFPTKFPTLGGLVTLVAACPVLQVLGLPLDARRVPELDDPPRETRFECLIAPESPIEDPRAVAAFLFQHLPCVTAVDARFLGPCAGVDVKEVVRFERAWEEVEMHLESLHVGGSFAEWGESDEEEEDEGGEWEEW